VASPIIRNTFFQLASKFTSILFALVSRKLLTNYLGPAGFGDYGFALAYASFFSSFADWGTQLIGIREASKSPPLAPSIFGSVIILRLVLSGVAFTVALLVLPLMGLSSSLQSAIFFACLLIVLYALKGSIGIIFDTNLRIKKWFIVELVTSTSSLLLVYLGVNYHLELAWFFVFLSAVTSLAIALALYLSRQISQINWKINLGLIKAIMLEAVPTGGILIVFGIYNRLDTFIIKHFLTPDSLGFYVLAYSIYENLTYLASYFTLSSLPKLSNTSSLNLVPLFQQIHDLLLTAGLCLAAAVSILATPIVMLLSSPEYTPSAVLLITLSLGLPLSYLNHATGYTLIAMGKQRKYLVISLVALLFNLFVNLLTIPAYGVIGAAATTVLTELVVQILSRRLVSQSINHRISLISFPKTIRQFIISRAQLHE